MTNCKLLKDATTELVIDKLIIMILVKKHIDNKIIQLCNNCGNNTMQKN